MGRSEGRSAGEDSVLMKTALWSADGGWTPWSAAGPLASRFELSSLLREAGQGASRGPGVHPPGLCDVSFAFVAEMLLEDQGDGSAEAGVLAVGGGDDAG